MASLLQTIKDLDIHVYKYIQMHACIHANRHTHILTSTDTQTHKHKKQDKVQFYQIQLHNAHKFSISASKFIFSFIVNFVHNS